MSSIVVGDLIRHRSLPSGIMDTRVLAVSVCDPADHAKFLIKDPETDEPDWVCGLEFVRVS